MRKLVITLLSLSLMAPAAALALGLGEIKLHSALNQRLDADIELLSVGSAEADDIDVSLASADTFSRVGLDRPAVLMQVRFEVLRRENGKYYVKATSSEVIREPFLDFLVEANWPGGRVMREYTLLLDPPVGYTETQPRISAPQTSAAEAPPTTTEQEEAFAPPPSSIPVAEDIKTPESAAAPQDDMVYGPVKTNDTLWAIAVKMRPNRDVSPQQMMMALLKANPYAFIDNNINRLKKGYVLRIDDPALITAMNKAEAARQVSRQNREWQDYRAAAAEKAADRQPADVAQAPAGSAIAAKSEPKLKLVTPQDEAGQAGVSADGESVSEGANEELMLALESSAAQRKENEALQSRVKGLEEQLQDMQRLLALKDDDLATLQKQLSEQGEAPGLPSDEAAMPAVDETGGESAENGAGPESEAVVSPGEEAEQAGEQVEEETSAEAAQTAKSVEDQAQDAAKPVAESKPKVQAKPRPQPVPQPSFFTSLMQDPMILAAGGGTVVLLLVLAMLLIRRRRKSGFQESILSGGTSSMLNAHTDEAAGETSFLSDLAISGIGGGAVAADEGEVDPLTEADVFMAYGRNQQAEEVLEKALESNPERSEVIAKLLEVYHAGNKKEQFEALVNKSADKLKGDSGIWSRIVVMGYELLPEHPLFADAEEPPAEVDVTEPVATKPEPVSDDVLDIGLDLDELSAEMESEGSDESFDLGVDFDLDEEKKPVDEPSAEGAEMDFDLELDSGADEFSTEPESAADATEETSDVEFDTADFSTEEEKPELSAESVSDELGDLDFGLGDVEAEEQPETKESATELDLGEVGGTEEKAADTLDLGDLDFGDLEFGTEEKDAAGDLTDDDLASLDLGELDSGDELGDYDDLGDLDEEGILSDSDEITTKLDLAQAYIEMGDNEGARSMLEEVVEAGNDEQQQQAQALLDKI
ncbi:MAG: hypothetical protein OQK54_06955 [Gammaproteobacteria bacterium]|nr:hypothetical protein [Gammaproteobacteria bacterium]